MSRLQLYATAPASPSAGDQIQACMYAQQVLYPLSYTPNSVFIFWKIKIAPIPFVTFHHIELYKRHIHSWQMYSCLKYPDTKLSKGRGAILFSNFSLLFEEAPRRCIVTVKTQCKESCYWWQQRWWHAQALHKGVKYLSCSIEGQHRGLFTKQCPCEQIEQGAFVGLRADCCYHTQRGERICACSVQSHASSYILTCSKTEIGMALRREFSIIMSKVHL